MLRFAVLAVLCGLALAITPPQESTMICDGGCLKSVAIGKDTRLEFPMVDGRPDLQRGVMFNVVVKIDSTQAHYEVRSSK